MYVRALDLFVTITLLEDTPTTEHPASTISESMSEEVRGNTEHGHSFLTYPESFLQRAQTLRRSTATAEWRSGWAPTLYRVWTQTACWEQGLQAFHRREAAHWTRRFTCQTLVLPPIDHSVDLRFSGKLSDTATGIGLRRWATSCSAGFTTVPTGARSKCRTIASLSLWARKLDVQFISRSHKYRETCRSCFQARTSSIKTHFPTGTNFPSRHQQVFGKQWTFHQILQPGKCCEFSFWWKQRSFACWSEIWTHEAGIQSGISQHLHLWTSAANSCSAIGIEGRPFTDMKNLEGEQVRLQRRVGHERGSTSRHSEQKCSRKGRIEETSRIAGRRILCAKIERKSWHDTESSLNKQKSCKRGWIAWVIPEYFKS